jgi:outer membrane protein OmpA-like peptidoglycan-associated protein
MRVTIMLCAYGAALLLMASAVPAQQRSFVSCPIVRDTKTVPCYLAEFDGETYYLGNQTTTGDFHAPQLKHDVLVEGTVLPGARVCGGIPLQPVSVSVLKELNLSCNTLLPAEPGIDAPLAPDNPVSVPTRALTGRQDFTVLYSFDDDHLDFRGERVLTEAAGYAKRIGAAHVNVAGYRATSLLSNGQQLLEKTGLAEKRAQNIASLLRGLGVAGVAVDWKNEAEPGNGQTDASMRRVNIAVIP